MRTSRQSVLIADPKWSSCAEGLQHHSQTGVERALTVASVFLSLFGEGNGVAKLAGLGVGGGQSGQRVRVCEAGQLASFERERNRFGRVAKLRVWMGCPQPSQIIQRFGEIGFK